MTSHRTIDPTNEKGPGNPRATPMIALTLFLAYFPPLWWLCRAVARRHGN